MGYPQFDSQGRLKRYLLVAQNIKTSKYKVLVDTDDQNFVEFQYRCETEYSPKEDFKNHHIHIMWAKNDDEISEYVKKLFVHKSEGGHEA